MALSASWRAIRPALRDGACAVLFVILIATRGTTARAVLQFPAGRAEVERVMGAIERATAAVPEDATVRIPNQRFAAAGPVIPGGFPGWAAVFAIWSPSNVVAGHRVVFVERDPTVVTTAANGRRSADLLVGPDPRDE
jgi:hypothetical protein